MKESTDYADYAEMKDERTYKIIGAAIYRELRKLNSLTTLRPLD